MRTLLRLVLLIALAALVGAAPAAADPEGPQIELASPLDGVDYYQGQQVEAAYGCFAGSLGWPVITCAGDLPVGAYVDTTTVGTHTFTVHAVDYAGAETTVSHTFTVVEAKDLPKTGPQVANCKICETLGKAHGANPTSDAPPKFPYLENGVGQKTPPKVDKPGDSGVTGPGKKGESINLTVTAPAGTKLYFVCLIHPWMQAEVDVT